MTPVAISANLLNGRHHDVVRHEIANHLAQQARVVSFQEAGDYLPIIRDLADEHGYRVIVARGGGRGMNSSVLLIRKDVRLIASGVMLVLATWIGPRLGIKWPGRGIPWAIVELDGDLVLARAIHGPTGRNAQNKRSWRRYLRRLRRQFRRKARAHKGLKVLDPGDWNCPAGARDKRSVRRLLADPIGARIANPGSRPPIDYAVTHLAIYGDIGPKFGSDHHSVRFYERSAA